MAGKKIGTLFLSKDHRREMKMEMSPEKAQYRRQAKRQRKEAAKPSADTERAELSIHEGEAKKQAEEQKEQ